MTRRSRPGSKTFGLGVLMPVVLLLPPLLFYLNVASSLALGAGIACLLTVALFILRERACLPTRPGGKFGFDVVVAALLVLVLAHAAIAATMLPFDLSRASASIVLLVAVLCGGYALGRLLLASQDVQVDRAAYAGVGLMTVAGLAAALGFAPLAADHYFKPVFPFTEPSQFAQAFLPLLMYCGIRAKNTKARFALLLFGLLVAGVLESLTLVVGWCLVAAVSLRTSVLPLLLVLTALIAAQLDLSYYIERIDFSGNTQNLSTLVYIQGWQLISESMLRSNGWGLGFQQLGVQGTNVPAASLINELLGENSNLLDGSFMLAKITSEFGFFGVFLVLAYLRVAWLAVVRLRQTSQSAMNIPAAVTFGRCVVASFLIEMFIRGTGYFSGTSVLLIAALVTRPAALIRLQSVKPSLRRRIANRELEARIA